MAAITSSTATSSLTRPGLVYKQPIGASSPFLLGLPGIGNKGRVTCTLEKKGSAKEAMSKTGMSASIAAAAGCAATIVSPAMALVDERMSTEGTGLPFGLSNNLLGWILLGVFGLVWSLYTVYTSGLDEDEESGLSL